MPSEENRNNTFETEVLNHLNKIDTTVTKVGTKMDLILSDNGETGMIPKLQARQDAVEKKIYWFSGAVVGVGGFLHWAIDAYRSLKGH